MTPALFSACARELGRRQGRSRDWNRAAEEPVIHRFALVICVCSPTTLRNSSFAVRSIPGTHFSDPSLVLRRVLRLCSALACAPTASARLIAQSTLSTSKQRDAASGLKTPFERPPLDSTSLDSSFGQQPSLRQNLRESHPRPS
ncbi:hypothetical protein N7510_009803 [Penicillium lagena]|uniref:uncharacterized protein n=1 Tax=Penicillium lagena TaxID=94218 RepID=UPI002541866A|nr:uncharacterized protein N7510_009803 [Penicillium lagena]KAJ5604649.1 hypothetical protein N7510_009803 [Penicillium lagena]